MFLLTHLFGWISTLTAEERVAALQERHRLRGEAERNRVAAQTAGSSNDAAVGIVPTPAADHAQLLDEFMRAHTDAIRWDGEASNRFFAF